MADPTRVPLLAIIPARGGSKRLPRKNVRLLGGRPLIAWTIAAARDSGAFPHVLVSTDDEEVAVAARAAGADVPWLRPAELATDTATTADVLSHALAWHESVHGPVEAVVLLQPTSPFRRPEAIREAVSMYLEQGDAPRRPVVSVSPAATHPAWCFDIAGDGTMSPALGWEPLRRRSQDLAPAHALNGSIYVIPAAAVRAGLPILTPGTRAYVMSAPEESIDIDDEADWQLAEWHLARAARGQA